MVATTLFLHAKSCQRLLGSQRHQSCTKQEQNLKYLYQELHKKEDIHDSMCASAFAEIHRTQAYKGTSAKCERSRPSDVFYNLIFLF